MLTLRCVNWRTCRTGGMQVVNVRGDCGSGFKLNKSHFCTYAANAQSVKKQFNAISHLNS
jgi:hypothetical protein